MIENGLFVLGGLETQMHDIFWAVHDGKKTRGRSEGEENIGEQLWWVVGGRAMRVSLIQIRAWVRGVGI